jgi:hypothetical protein
MFGLPGKFRAGKTTCEEASSHQNGEEASSSSDARVQPLDYGKPQTELEEKTPNSSLTAPTYYIDPDIL